MRGAADCNRTQVNYRGNGMPVHGDGHMTVYTCQNTGNSTLKSVDFTVYKLYMNLK